MVTIVPHGISLTGVKSMAIEEVNHALEKIVEPCSSENEPKGDQHRLEIVGGQSDIVAGQEIDEEAAERKSLKPHEATKEEVALDGPIEEVVSLFDGKDVLGHLPDQVGVRVKDGCEERYFNEQDDGDDVIQIGSVGQTEADVSLKKPVVHCAFFSVGDSYIPYWGRECREIWIVAPLIGILWHLQSGHIHA